jgi:capsule synthesis protein PGA_cap
MCNLECAIYDRGAPWDRTEKAFHFASYAKNVAVLQVAQIDASAPTNNLVLDFAYEPLRGLVRWMWPGFVIIGGDAACSFNRCPQRRKRERCLE